LIAADDPPISRSATVGETKTFTRAGAVSVTVVIKNVRIAPGLLFVMTAAACA
jgi:hypothetical protein